MQPILDKSAMTVLCIETSTKVCSAALCKDGAVLEQLIEREEGNHARLLPTYIDRLIKTAREKNLSIDAVALSEGPGSYTGLRIGTSTAKGLCYGLDVPLIPIPTLQILCEAAKKQKTASEKCNLCPMIDARRMEVYTALYNADLQSQTDVCAVVVENEDSLYSMDKAAFASSTEQPVYYFGDGAAKCQSVLAQPNWQFIDGIVPEAQYMGALAENGMRKVEGTDLAYYEPFYLKEFVAAQSHVKGLNG